VKNIKRKHLLDALFIFIFIFIMFQISTFQTKKKDTIVIEKPKTETFSNPIFDFTFIDYPNVRDISREDLGINLSDIESHLPSNHAYSHQDLITWGHESTHGINSNIRNSQSEPWSVNAFYCLRNRAVVLKEPKTRITKFANKIPQILRGPSYNLYLKQQTKYWDDRPLYILDEWIAYTNGAEVGIEMKAAGWDYELLQAHNFNVYVVCLAMEIQLNCPDYDDLPFFGFVKWNIERVMNLTQQAKNLDVQKVARVQEYLDKIKTHSESEKFREFCRGYFGNEWCQKVYDF